MHSAVTTSCTTCVHRDRPVVIVGCHRFNNRVLAHFIQANTPAQCIVFDSLDEVTFRDELLQPSWQLIFIDSHGLIDNGALERLQADAHLFQNNIVALYNLTQNNPLLLQMLKAGVRGFFFEKDPSEFILKGICVLKRGELWVNREIMMHYIAQPKERDPENHTTTPLTSREKVILSLLASGAKNETIASSLYISPHTVKTHLYNILKKTGLQNRLQAALWAAKNLT